ncbi:MAG: murein transglycosylase domain-containing protein [Sulfurimonas sp.]|uniref:murein transglycosylase domain-containing protein n=1 Tax=Sulfurimonas sp. TaxID=2022749 RepID=UPI0028CC5AE2|nr:murein transglycosylase domain-containing protein [Sulfurimonas sp.]MDT8338190.1 murein transglycosylase domain-containing protein [Sulfurimonas sp.]
MFVKTLISLSLSSLLLAQIVDDFKNTQMETFEAQKNQFDSYKTDLDDEFSSYQESLQKEYDEYKKELSIFWEEPIMSTKKRWVAYSEDKKTRTDVDFENETIVVETIASSEQEANEKLKKALANVITIDTKKAHERDPLEQRLTRVKKPSSFADTKIEPEPILSTVIFDKEPSKDALISYVNEKTKDKNIRSSSSKKVKGARVYTLNISMPSDAMLKRSRVYYDEVKKQSLKQNIPLPLIFAVIHSESSYNPRARSHVPAYGLMQIVPKTAGIDSYLFLYKERKLLSESYLYDSKNNITMGSAYLHILYYKYLSKINDPKSRLYCTIAAYNTGAGNVAWAFTKTNNMHKAAPIINALTPDEVYDALLRDLKYDEPREYLKKVSKRMTSYHKAYQ